MSAIKFFSGMILSTIFVIALLSYMFGFAVDNNAQVSLINDSDFRALNSSLIGNSSSYSSEVNSSSFSFGSTTVESGSDITTTGGEFKGAGVVSSYKMVESMGRAISSKILGNDPGFGIIINMVFALLTFMAFVYIWKIWKGGNPD